MADRFSSRFPNVLLGIKRWTAWREVTQGEPGMVSQEGTDRLARVPGRTVEEQQDGLHRKNRQYLVEEMKGSLAVEGWHRQGNFLAGGQGQRAEKMETVALGSALSEWSLPHRNPTPGKRGLKLEADLVHHPHDPVRMVLAKIGPFFSVSPSH